MSSWLLERTINCPYCAEPISIVIDLSAGAQSYIEDCQICCQPMEIAFDVDEGELTGLRVERSGWVRWNLANYAAVGAVRRPLQGGIDLVGRYQSRR